MGLGTCGDLLGLPVALYIALPGTIMTSVSPREPYGQAAGTRTWRLRSGDTLNRSGAQVVDEY